MNRQAVRPARVLICDLDGTRIDSAPDMTAAMGHLPAEHLPADAPVATFAELPAALARIAGPA